MKHRFLSFTLAIAIIASLSSFSAPLANISCYPNSQTFYMETASGETYPVTMPLAIYNIKQSNYIRIRDAGYLLDFQVEYDGSKNAVSINTHGHSDGKQISEYKACVMTDGTPSSQTVYIDGVQAKSMTMYQIMGNNYVKIRDLAAAVNFGCVYNKELKAVVLSRDFTYTANDVMTAGSSRQISYTVEGESLYSVDGLAPTGGNESVPENGNDYGILFKEPDQDYSRQANSLVQNYMGDNQNYIDQFNACVQTIIDSDEIYESLGIPFEEVTGQNYVSKTCKYVPFQFEDHGVFKIIYTLWITAHTFDKEQDLMVYTVPTGMNYAEIKENYPELITKVNNCTTMREKAYVLAHAVCDRMSYGSDCSGNKCSIHDIWSSHESFTGVCSDYSLAYRQLCRAFKVPFISVKSEDHAWDLVYLPEEQTWIVVDTSGADLYGWSDYYVGGPISAYPLSKGMTINDYSSSMVAMAEAVRIGYSLKK